MLLVARFPNNQQVMIPTIYTVPTLSCSSVPQDTLLVLDTLDFSVYFTDQVVIDGSGQILSTVHVQPLRFHIAR